MVINDKKKLCSIVAIALATTQLLLSTRSVAHEPHHPQASPTLDPNTLEKYVDSLPRPAVAEPVNWNKRHEPVYRITMSQFIQKLHRDLPPTTVYGYNGTYPGPTIETRTDEPIHVQWTNNLPSVHLLPVDTTVFPADLPGGRAVTHLHGGHTEAQSDGHPNAWFTQNFAQTGSEFFKKTYDYDNNQPGTTLWYHDHALGVTRLNVYAGLAGFYLLRDHLEDSLHLPRGKFEIPIALQDRSFNNDGSLFYPGDTINGVTPSIVPEFFGNISVVNGKIWPRLIVKPRKYRIRFLDGSNGRFYNIQLFEYNEVTKTFDLNKPGPAFVQIGAEQGFLPKPVQINGRLLMGPGERADTLIDFSQFAGKSLLLHNNAKTPFQSPNQVSDQVPLPEIMLIQVENTCGRSCQDQDAGDDDSKQIPEKLAEVGPTDEAHAVITRDIKMAEATDTFGRPILLLNDKRFDALTTELPILGTKEIWRFINTTPDFHPMHIHLVRFRVLDRQAFDVATYLATGQLIFTGSPVPADPTEAGFKDTMKSPPGFVTRVISLFDRPGKYVYHCHILEHEEYDMMRPFTVIETRNYNLK